MSEAETIEEKEARLAWKNWDTDKEQLGIFGFFLAIGTGIAAGYAFTLLPMSLLQILLNIFGAGSDTDTFLGPFLGSIWNAIQGIVTVISGLCGFAFFMYMRKNHDERRIELEARYGRR